MEKICDDHNPLIITRRSSRPVVMLFLEDYQAMEETTYLSRSPKNAKRLLESIVELENGEGVAEELIEWIEDFPTMHGMITYIGEKPIKESLKE